MTDEEILSELAQILVEIAGVDAAEVQPDSVFGSELDVDSLLMVEILVAIEQRFSIVLPEAGPGELVCVADLLRLVTERLVAA